MIVRNLTQNTILSEKAEIADNFFSRAKGLLGRTELLLGYALIITQCNSIHMFFMKFAIDVVFLDKNGCVVGLVKNIKPWKMSPIFWKSSKVIELPAGAIDRFKIKVGDILEIKK